MIPSNNAKLFTPQLPASTIATSANLESGDMAAPMISTLLMVLVPIAVAVLLGFVLAVWCVRRSSNRQASNECDTEAAPAAAWSNQGRRLSQDVLLQFAPPPEYAYARRGSVVSTSSKIEDEEGDDETYALSVSTGLARLELERVHRMSMFSELTYETTKSTPSPAVQYKRPSDEEIPEILMVSSEVVRIINTPATDVVSSRAEDTPPVKQVGPLKIMFGFVYFERRRWPVAKAAGGRWVWIGENTQVYRGPYDEEVEVTILSGRKDAEAVFHEERLSVQGVDPKLILHWEILLTFF
ncbi:hypothetical protein BC830DRAFT_1094210 [Chytriomyces sp. MP71]|nr:hypothetical protein BC830DRAFT_1094210 [Chytriomyces sp. MP71]